MEKEIKTETKIPVALQDFTGDIAAYIDKLPIYEKVVNRPIPLRSSMWTLFSAIVDTHIQDEYVKEFKDYPEDMKNTLDSQDFTFETMNSLMENINNQIDTEKNLISLAHMCGIAYLKIREYESLFSRKDPELNTSAAIKEPLEG